ncbi:hypothetical protein L1049_020852 [Liquidambar formosana]|uniref:Uncharacterized protein n=1 Tax=Liquidambar formosana TaxID=63359 RepID=A0AAP0X6F4_LIQFO
MGKIVKMKCHKTPKSDCFPYLESIVHKEWTCCGIYISQNYDVPNLKKLANTALFKAKQIEERYRKPKKRDDDN